MEQKPADPLKTHDTATELKAVVEARRELGPEMEEHLLTSFLGRIEQRVDARVNEELSRRSTPSRANHARRGASSDDIGLAASTFALAIPLVVVAGIFGGGIAIWAVMGAVVVVNLLYLIDRWR